MKKKIKLYYKKYPNMGDLLNENIIKKLFGYDVINHTVFMCEMSAIGSGMEKFTWSKKRHLLLLQKISNRYMGNVVIWGSGFLYNNAENESFFREDTIIKALRGNLSKIRAEKAMNDKLNIAVGDPGILASSLIKQNSDKYYSVGIIPHFREYDNESIFSKLHERFKRSIIISVKDDPIKVIEKIAQCETIISSSLHGLIVADSFHIPNQLVIVSDKPRGDGFKYKDYYSAFGLDAKPVDLRRNKIKSLMQIIDNYVITEKMVEQCKKGLIDCFPF